MKKFFSVVIFALVAISGMAECITPFSVRTSSMATLANVIQNENTHSRTGYTNNFNSVFVDIDAGGTTWMSNVSPLTH